MLFLQTCDSGPAAPPDPGLMDIDTDMEFPQHLGIDNDALDINDINFMDDNDSVDLPAVYNYQLHPNNYLLTYHLGSDPDDSEAAPMLDRQQQPGPVAHFSPESQRYVAMGGLHPPVRIPQQDPEAGPRKKTPIVRGMMFPGNNVSSDKLCQLEDSEEEENCDNSNSEIKRTPSPRVTRV